ncbi:MAG: ATP-binding protein [Verrucomicrobiota bacterium]|nr:ATP-binding protein [Verrucomicrobiota bacterium]
MKRQLFALSSELFKTFYFHESGRFFVIDNTGRILVHPEEFMRGKSISNKFLYEEGNESLLKKIRSNKTLISQYTFEEFDEHGSLRKKQLFVSWVAGSDLFICISVLDSDIFFSSSYMRNFLTAILIIVFLLILLVLHVSYLLLKKRYNAVVFSAEMIVDGDYDSTINDSRGDEIGVLAGVIDKLARRLREKQKLEDQLRRAQQMEVVGTLASGISHDFKNILGGILGASSLIKKEIEKNLEGNEKLDHELIDKMLNVATDACNKGSRIVDQLLSFSRSESTEKKTADLNHIVKKTVELCRHSFDKNVSLIYRPFYTKAVAKVNKTQLEQAIYNLCLNARDAIPNGGDLFLKITDFSIDITKTALKWRFPNVEIPLGDYYCISISDNGCGIDPQIQDRIFEPFYTTKEEGKGTGLGLSMVFKIVNDHKGWIDVESEKDLGTTFRIYLPKSKVFTTKDDTQELRKYEFGSETLLLVDDDETLLSITHDMLSSVGYKIHTYGNGSEAIHFYRENHQNVDLVILNLVMGDLSGDFIFEQMKKINKNIKVVIISIREDDERIKKIMENDCIEFLQKPFNIESLTHSLRLVLDR